MPLCPPITQLPTFRVCGSVQELCPEGAPSDLRVSVTLEGPRGKLIDPTTNAIVLTGSIQNEDFLAVEDGCWCTCPLLPNFNSQDPTQALEPASTSYLIRVTYGGRTVVDESITIDGATAPDLVADHGHDCGDCINICDLMDIVPTIPAPASLCDAVADCVADDLEELTESIAELTAESGAACVPLCSESGETIVLNIASDGTVSHMNIDGSTFTGDTSIFSAA